MATAAKILVIDDTPLNVKMLVDLLGFKGYRVVTASNGREGLKQIELEKPDLVLLDIMMPDLSGYEVCRTIRENPASALLPVVLVTSLDPTEERVKGLEAGADDFLSRPINQPELLARVRSLLRVKHLHDELADLNATLEQRINDQVAELERLAKLKRFVSPKIGELILAGEIDDPMKTRRRELTVVFADLRGFTAFSETTAPEEVMDVLRDYHSAIGQIAMAHDGTIEHFAGDSVMVVFNDPVPLPNHELTAIRAAAQMRDAITKLGHGWERRGYELGFGIGIANGYATIGAIGFEGRRDYGVVGPVTNLAARLCAEAQSGQILISQRALGNIEGDVETERIGVLQLKGIQRPVLVHNVVRLASGASDAAGQ